jgi:hypothetical protein
VLFEVQDQFAQIVVVDDGSRLGRRLIAASPKLGQDCLAVGSVPEAHARDMA